MSDLRLDFVLQTAMVLTEHVHHLKALGTFHVLPAAIVVLRDNDFAVRGEVISIRGMDRLSLVFGNQMIWKE
jgi:hypothetical protein